jgi:hypothetical protein
MRQQRFDSITAVLESGEREATALCGNREGHDEFDRRLFDTFAAGFPLQPPTPTVRVKPGSSFEHVCCTILSSSNTTQRLWRNSITGDRGIPTSPQCSGSLLETS